MTGKHFLIMEHDPHINRFETVARLFSEKSLRKRYPESIYPYLASLEIFSIDMIRKTMIDIYKHKDRKIMLKLASTRQLKETFNDAFINTLLVRAEITDSIDTLIKLGMEDNLKKIYVNLIESVYIHKAPICIFPMSLSEQMRAYNHLLGHVLFECSTLSNDLRIEIARALIEHGTTDSPEKILNAIIRR